MAHAREAGRVKRDDGYTEVTIYVDNTTRAMVLVATDMVDGPGYQDVLDLRLAHHQGLTNIIEGNPAR